MVVQSSLATFEDKAEWKKSEMYQFVSDQKKFIKETFKEPNTSLNCIVFR